MPSVVQDWVSDLPFRMQATLLSALRGCDGKPKEDPSKKLTRKLRGVMLKPAFSKRPEGSFMHDNVTIEDCRKFVANLDPYPMHWLMHFTHACEIVAYKHPDLAVRFWWRRMYVEIVHALHLNMETEEQLEKRLAPGDLG